MKKELNVMEATPNSGEIILQEGYKNVLLTNIVAESEYGLVNVNLLITSEMSRDESMNFLRMFADRVEGPAFLGWFPLNDGANSYIKNNFGMDKEDSEAFCKTLISLFGLKSLALEAKAAA